MCKRSERNISIRLSDFDCKKLANLCGEYGITLSELFENFVGDLIGSAYTNGSDERMLANDWFNRCSFGMFPPRTLLNHLLHYGYDPDKYFDWIIQLDVAFKEIQYLGDHPEEADSSDIPFLNDMISDCKKSIKSMTEGWSPDYEFNLTDEIHSIAKWIDEKNQIIHNPSYEPKCEAEFSKLDNEIMLSAFADNYSDVKQDCYTLSI